MLISTKRALSDAKYSSSFWEHWNKCQCLFWYLPLPSFLSVLRCVGCKSISSHHLMYFFQLVCCMCVLFLLCAFGYFLNLNTPPPQKRKKKAKRDKPEIPLHILEIGGPTFSSVLCTHVFWCEVSGQLCVLKWSNQIKNKTKTLQGSVWWLAVTPWELWVCMGLQLWSGGGLVCVCVCVCGVSHLSLGGIFIACVCALPVRVHLFRSSRKHDTAIRFLH